MANAIQDLRKVKLSTEVMSQNLTAGLTSLTGASANGSGNASGLGISGSGNGPNNNDPEIDHVIERCLDEEIVKPHLDTYCYRLVIFLKDSLRNQTILSSKH